MKKTLIQAIFPLLVLLLPLASLAQFTIKGVVTDVANNPLIGATVRMKNGTRATFTDATGKFSLTLPGTRSVVEISFIGFGVQTFNVDANNNNLLIKLIEDAGKMDEVVVSGLATSIKRSNLANSVAS